MSSESVVRPARAANRRSGLRVLSPLAATALLTLVVFGCLGGGPDAEDPTRSDPQLRMARIEELKRAIAQDHATLEDLMTRPEVEDALPLYDDPVIRTIAARLTQNERALEELEAAAATATAK